MSSWKTDYALKVGDTAYRINGNNSGLYDMGVVEEVREFGESYYDHVTIRGREYCVGPRYDHVGSLSGKLAELREIWVGKRDAAERSREAFTKRITRLDNGEKLWK